MARLSRRLLIAASGLLVAGCLSPTLPLPPPSKPTVEGPDEQGMVTLDGYAQANSPAYALNSRTGDIRGQITENDGHYNFQIAAEVGDELSFWYSVGTDNSPSIVFQIQKPK
jgi:hypothetical protein